MSVRNLSAAYLVAFLWGMAPPSLHAAKKVEIDFAPASVHFERGGKRALLFGRTDAFEVALLDLAAGRVKARQELEPANGYTFVLTKDGVFMCHYDANGFHKLNDRTLKVEEFVKVDGKANAIVALPGGWLGVASPGGNRVYDAATLKPLQPAGQPQYSIEHLLERRRRVIFEQGLLHLGPRVVDAKGDTRCLVGKSPFSGHRRDPEP